MPIRRRKDGPGEWFHVMNRGIARRTVFETREDVAVFCGQLEKVVGQGRLEVHAFTFLTTHFHLLVRSPLGELSEALRVVQLNFVRHFNRQRRRDGSLFRGRFTSKVVDSLAYRRVLVGYIDANAPRAGLVDDPAEHEFGSCRSYVLGGGPAWLTRDWVEADVRERLVKPRFDGRDYRRVFPEAFCEHHAELVERRASAASESEDPTDSLLAGAGPAVLEWMRRKAGLADGTAPGIALASTSAVAACMDAADGTLLDRAFAASRRALRPRTAVHAFLLRVVVAMPIAAIARELGLSVPSAGRHVERARSLVQRDDALASHVAAVALIALRSCAPASAPS